MSNVRTLDSLKSINIKAGKTVDSVQGLERVTGTTWNPGVGAAERAQAEYEAYEKFKALREAEQQLDPTQIRLYQLEQKVKALEELVLSFVDRSSING